MYDDVEGMERERKATYTNKLGKQITRTQIRLSIHLVVVNPVLYTQEFSIYRSDTSIDNSMQCVQNQNEQLLMTFKHALEIRPQDARKLQWLPWCQSCNFGRESCSVHKQNDNSGVVTAETTKCVCGQRERQRDE